MPYPTLNSLPDAVKKMPEGAQHIFQSAFNSAFEQYKGDEGKSNAVAWAAVKSKYEKKDDQWVARESIEPLRLKYAELIQEQGKRNASADSGRIRKIMDLCQELLSSEPTEQQAQEALTESISCLSWLKLQEAIKTEDGVAYPASAFAYTPDPDKPSDWKLRLWEDPEKKVTRKQAGAAAAALSPGGFRGQKADIPAADLPAVKRKIRAAYHSLDVADEDIPRWVMEASMIRTVISDYIPLTEAKIGGKGSAQIVVIKPGLNANKERYYPSDMLARDFAVFEGVKMFADHPTVADEKDRPERSVRDWVATLKNVHVGADGAVLGEAVVVEPWLQERLATLRDKNMLADIGVSINAIGTATKGTMEGVKTNVIERIVRARSVDFVTEAGAGGEGGARGGSSRRRGTDWRYTFGAAGRGHTC